MVDMEVKRAIAARVSVCVRVRERERERRVVGRRCKFFFTAGWRVKKGHLECTGGHGAWEVWVNNTTDSVIPTIWEHVFLVTFWAEDVAKYDKITHCKSEMLRNRLKKKEI